MATAAETANPLVVIRQNLSAMAPEFKAALPDHVSVEKFTRVAMTAIQNTPALVNADRRSLFGAFVRLAQDGLLPDGREAAVVMFGQKAQAMPMIAGILKKVRQSGDVAKISAYVVHENDQFTVRYGFDEDVEHIPPPLNKPRGEAIGAYATAVLKDGSKLLEVMSLEEIEKVRKVSRAANNGPWVSWWGEMARKTVMRRLSKRLPMSTDLEDEVFSRDETMAHQPGQMRVVSDNQEVPARISHLDAIEHQIGGGDAHDEETGEVIDTPVEQPEITDQAEAIEAEIEEAQDEESPAAKAAQQWMDSYDKAETIIDLKGLHSKSEMDRAAMNDELSAAVEKSYADYTARLKSQHEKAKAEQAKADAEAAE